MEWDAGHVYAVPQGLRAPGAAARSGGGLTNSDVEEYTKRFIRDFRVGTVFIYRERLLNNAQQGRYHLEIDLEHLKNFSEELHDVITKHPAQYLENMEKGARDFLKRQETYRDAQLVQITFIGQLRLTPIREITAAEVNRMLLVPGIVINAGHTRPRAIKLSVRCRECNLEKLLDVPPEGCSIPSSCPGGGGVEGGKRCPRDSFEVHPDHCEYVDEQRIKLQEAPETVPTGEMPRTMEVIVDRVYAGRISPGTRVRMLAIACIRRGDAGGGGGGGGGGAGRGAGRGGAVALRHPYLRVVGVVGDEEGGGRQAITTFTPEEEARMKALAADPDIFARLAASVAPSIAGDYTDDIKKAILCLLLGGRWKRLPDGMRLRGDINMLMLGDPSTAKSQFLKFVERVAPVSVYTSGKGSSAAGLTASVVKDMRGEFRLEGGAMVLADGGVVCIDEFDKMRDEDRVAIHEAMEQQTISVAKAGITTILNSRCSVLAAANPKYGRYDDSKSIADNIDLLPTILSRFDLIFIVRDTRDADRDRLIARHVVALHVTARDTTEEQEEGEAAARKGGEIDLGTMKKFIAYARSKCAPVVTGEAAEMLAGEYADIRQMAEGAAREKQAAAAGSGGGGGGGGERGERGGGAHTVGCAVPITVRQLEALVRVTEAVAKASLSREATLEHVKEALALFKKSTLAAAQQGNGLGDVLSADMQLSVRACEARILKVVGAGQTLPVAHVKGQLRAQGFDEGVINTALRVMDSREEIKLVDERKMVRRHK